MVDQVIAQLKAQTNAVYRKEGVNGASQLLSLFLDDLMEDRFLSETAEQVA